MKHIEETVFLKDHGRIFCTLTYDGLNPAEYHAEFGHAWCVSPPNVENLSLVKAVDFETSQDLLPTLSKHEVEFIMEHVECLILAGEGV